MFSLIIAIVSIALVVALVALSSYHGGCALSDAQAQAQAARLKNEEQQIMAAVDFFQADNHRWPVDVAELVATSYLRSVPAGVKTAEAAPQRIDFIASAHAQATPELGWNTPVASVPVFSTSTTVPKEVCRKYNLVSRGDDGILNRAFDTLQAQCFGANGSYQVVVMKRGFSLAPVFGQDQVADGGLPHPDGGDAWWDVQPDGPVKAPVDPDKVPFAKLALSSTAAANFGDVALGESASVTRTVRNSGNATLTSLSVAVSEGFGLVDNSCASDLAAGASCDFKVQFSPLGEQAYAGAVTVASANGGAASFQVAGTGVVLRPVLEWATNALDFGGVTIGQTRTLEATLRNTGKAEARHLIGNLPPNFSAISGGPTPCGATLAAGSSCTVDFTFHPATPVAYSGDFVIPAVDAPELRLRLSGTGLPTPATLTNAQWPTVAVGGSQPGGQRLTNISGAPLSLTATPTVNAPFRYTGTDCPTPLAPGASCWIFLQFEPTDVGTFTQTLQVQTSVGALSSTSRGFGAYPEGTLTPTLTFGTIRTATTATLSATLSNTGSIAMGLVAPTASSVTGTGFSFVSTTCGTSLDVGANCTVTVRYTASGTAAANGELVLNTGAGERRSTLTGQSMMLMNPVLSSASWGYRPVGQLYPGYQELHNMGDLPISVTGTPTANSPYTYVSHNCPAQLMPGSKCQVYVNFTPPSVGQHDLGLWVPTNAGWIYSLSPGWGV